MLRRRSSVLVFGTVLTAFAQPVAYDLILRNGTVYDGTGGKPYRADVAVRNGHIAKIGRISGVRASAEIDVKGLAVAPGFVNIHSHATAEGLQTAVNMLTQGVTTEIVNADGASSLDIGAQLRDVGKAGLAVNVGACVGFNSVWRVVVGEAERRPTAAEMERMRGLVTANLQAGAWCLSAGLDYKPGYFARTDEVVAVAKAAAEWRTNFPNHDRLTPESGYSSLVAMAETITIGKQAGVLPVITHMKVQGKEQGSAGKAINLLREGAAVADVYPYLAGQTSLAGLFIPAWAVSGGRAEMLQRFADPALRPRIAREIDAAIAARVLTPANVDLPAMGKTLAVIMREENAGAGETVMRILAKDSPGMIATFGAEPDLQEILRFPGSAVSCDCGAVAPGTQGAHPRYWGTFPRVLGHYSRDEKLFPLEEAVRRMTGLPASIIGMVDRGLLAPGMAADIAVFDPALVMDRATFAQPLLPSEGIVHVLVNGRVALRDGKPTGQQAGAALRRAADMPSRAVVVGKARLVSAQGSGLRLAVMQSADGKSRGRLTYAAPGVSIGMEQPGVLQTAEKWASFTAQVRVMPGGEVRSATVIVDGANPLLPGARVRILLEGGAEYTVGLPAGGYRIR